MVRESIWERGVFAYAETAKAYYTVVDVSQQAPGSVDCACYGSGCGCVDNRLAADADVGQLELALVRENNSR